MPLRWLLLVHASDEPQIFALPPGRWHTVLDSAAGWVLPDAQWRAAPACTQAITAAPRTMLGLVQHVTNPVLPLEARA